MTDIVRSWGRRAQRMAERLGPRQNLDPLDIASWAMAILVLSVLIPTVEAIAGNEAFFAAHGIGSIIWLLATLVACALAWAGMAALARLALRLPERPADLVLTAATFAIAWFGAGNALARTAFGSLPAAGWILGAALGALVAYAARRWRAGRVLVACAAVACALPVLTSALQAQSIPKATLEFATAGDGASRPSIAWIISDELQYPLVFDAAGRVRPQFPNLAALQEQSTTYTRAFATANYTDFAVPAMMNGVTDVSAVADNKRMRASLGFIPGLASEYAIVMESPIYSFSCDDPSCVTADVISERDTASPITRLAGVMADTAAVAGRSLADPLADLFPSLDGKWRDFWAGGDEFGAGAPGNTVGSAIAQWQSVAKSGVPTFTFWHSIRTHAPWAVDRAGKDIYPPRLPVVEGAHMVGTDPTGLMRSAELASMERRLYANAAVDFDRQLGLFIDALKQAGTYDDTMIVVTADHGAGITFRGDRRMGDSAQQRWAEVAHVPLMIKGPGQVVPEVVTSPRSNGQIARTIVEQAGAEPGPELALGPSLSTDLPSAPVFSTVAGGRGTPWQFDGIDLADPWSPQDIAPPDPAHPFAIGIDLDLLGSPVPPGWTRSAAAIELLPGSSDQVLLVARGRDDEPGCGPASVGLITAGQTTGSERIIGSVLWEDSDRADGRWGWAIVGKEAAGDYAAWCAVG